VLFQIGQHCERIADFALALSIYRDCAYPGARQRMIRVLERCGEYELALELATQAEQSPESAAEQQPASVLPRLRRKLGGPALKRASPRPVERLDLQLPRLIRPCRWSSTSRRICTKTAARCITSKTA
jgi:hypothetical protein